METQVKTALSKLLGEVQPIVDKHLEEMDPQVITYALQYYAKYLKIDLARDFEKARKENLTYSPFDDLLSEQKDT